jgi:hypothetical protein
MSAEDELRLFLFRYLDLSRSRERAGARPSRLSFFAVRFPLSRVVDRAVGKNARAFFGRAG